MSAKFQYCSFRNYTLQDTKLLNKKEETDLFQFPPISSLIVELIGYKLIMNLQSKPNYLNAVHLLVGKIYSRSY